tara:strand:- start:2912 stop:3118 length:207 start_codon:yes stop_codon:yes gene_type:complete
MIYLDTKAINNAIGTLQEVLSIEDMNKIREMLRKQVQIHYEGQIQSQTNQDLVKLNIDEVGNVFDQEF